MSKRPIHKFRAIIFDMDVVITNTMPYHYDAWLDTFASVGIKVNCYDIYCREGQDGLSTVKEIYAENRRKFNLKQAKQLLARKENLFKRIVRPRFIKGSRPFVRDLKRRNFLLALVTGTSRHEVRKILPRKLFNFFDVTITGSDVKKGKPNPEPFLKALKALKIPAQEVVVIENAPFGIEAAKRAHLFCIALQTSLPKSYLLEADVILKSFKELRQRINFIKEVGENNDGEIKVCSR